MTRKQKLRYIWEYYWLPIVGITAGIIFLIYFLYHLLFATKEYWFYVTFVNIRPQTGVESELMEEFVSERGYDLSNCYSSKPRYQAAPVFHPDIILQELLRKPCKQITMPSLTN